MRERKGSALLLPPAEQMRWWALWRWDELDTLVSEIVLVWLLNFGDAYRIGLI